MSNLLVMALVLSTGLTAGLTALLTPSKRVAPSNRGPAASPQFSDAGFAGYVFRTSAVDRASAIVTVPTLYAPRIGSASTWIGIEAPGNPFLQVGVIEDSYQTASGPRALYVAFWSDTALDFIPSSLPRQLIPAYGDRLRLSITQRSSRWVLEVDDLTSGETAIERTKFASGVVFNQVDWTQEDPVQLDHPLGHVPYPSLGPTQFSDLSANGRNPDLSSDQATDMDVGGAGVVVPTAPDNDGFETHLATDFEYQYLNLVAPYNAALDDFFSKLEDHTRGTHVPGNVYFHFSLAITPFDPEVTLGALWPASVQSDINRLEQADTALELKAVQVGVSGSYRLGDRILVRLERKASVIALAIRQRLGLAPPNRVVGFDDLFAN